MLYTEKQKMIITEVMVIANYQKMISIQQIRNLISKLSDDPTDMFESYFLVLQILDMLNEYKQIKLVVHEYLLLNCETLA